MIFEGVDMTDWRDRAKRRRDSVSDLSSRIYPESAVPEYNSAAARPTSVYVAYGALLTAASASAVLAGIGIYGLTQLRGSVDRLLQLDPTGTATLYAHDYVDNVETTLMSSTVGLGVVFALAYVLVAHAVRVGHGWPRLTGTLLSVLSLPAIFLGPIAVVIVLAGISAVIALWTPSARRYAVGKKVSKRLGL